MTPHTSAATKPHLDRGGSIRRPQPQPALILGWPNPCAKEGLSHPELVGNPALNLRLIWVLSMVALPEF